jgi:hypothetical protein
MEGRFRGAGALALIVAILAVGLGTVGIATADTSPLTGTLHVRTQMFRTTSKVQYALTLDSGEELRLHPRRTDTAGINAYAEERVQITGARHGDDVTVTGVKPAATSRAAAALTLPTSGPRAMKLAVFMVNFTNDRRVAYTAAQLQSALFTGTKSTAKYWSESTGGLVTMTGSVFGTYQLNIDSGDCTQIGDWMVAAKAAATKQGVNLASFTNYELWFPWTASCGGWAGIGDIGGPNTWIETPPSYPDLTWAWPAHELGHNLNLLHSSAWNCSNGAAPADPTTCPHDEYGDPFDVMGAVWANGGRLATAVHRVELGNLVPKIVTGPGTYTLTPAEATNAATTQVIEMPRPDGTSLWLEFHRTFGTFDTFAASDPAVNGVTMRVTSVDDGGRMIPHLIDSSPGDNDMTNAPFAAGRSFTDPITHFTIVVNSVSATGATVTVAPPAAPPIQASVAAGVLNVTAGAGVNDNITVVRNASTGKYIVTANNTIAPGAGCAPFTTKQVQCSNVTSSVVKGGNGDDVLTVNAGSQPTNISGGTGNDTLTGGSGVDKLTGAGGNDVIFAKDGKADVVNCKAGSDIVTVDPTDKTKDCETVKF